MNSIVNSFRREARRLAADPWDLAMVTWVPLLAVALLWWIFSAGLPRHLPVGMVDEDHSSLSRQLVRMLDATPGVRIAQNHANAAEAERALRALEVYAVVTIPRDFARTVKEGRAAQVTLLHNAQMGTHSGLLQRDVRAAVGTLSAGIEMAARNKRGESAQAVRVSREPIHTQLVALFNVSSNYEQFLGAALIPALLHILAMTAGAWTVGRELRDRSLGEWLGTGRFVPVAGALLGKLVLPWAMEIIESLEPTRRALYAGTVGYVDASGDMDMAIAIRTAVLHQGRAYVQAGAGIVADSDPATEEAETRHKARAVLSAIATAEGLRELR